MNHPTSKEELLGLIETEHTHLEQLLQSLEETPLSQIGVPSGWTEEAKHTGVAVKDILMHLTCWEQRMLAYMEASLAGTTVSDKRYTLTAPRFNRLVFEENRHREAVDILQEYRRQYAQVLQTLQELEEAALLKVNAGGLIGYNTYSHYRWAIKKIRVWLRQQKETTRTTTSR